MRKKEKILLLRFFDFSIFIYFVIQQEKKNADRWYSFPGFISTNK